MMVVSEAKEDLGRWKENMIYDSSSVRPAASLSAGNMFGFFWWNHLKARQPKLNLAADWDQGSNQRHNGDHW